MSDSRTPSGGRQPVALLLTDIEASTRLWEADPRAMEVALQAHDLILRQAAEHAQGTYVKSTGDGMLATFTGPEAAIEAAIDGQHALAAQTWVTAGPIRVRMAIHVGSVESRDGDLFGPPLNRVARLLGTAHGGQILVSGVAATLAAARLPAEAEVLDLGQHRLRDLDTPEHIFQVVARGLTRDFPPLRSLNERQTNLPIQVTSFIGRVGDVAEVHRLLDEGRLVTLVGVGGTGKTRLMLRAAADEIEHHRDGVWLVELAPITDPALVVQAVGDTLGLQAAPGRQLPDVIIDFLRTKDLLLLIDNCEHLVAATAALVLQLLANAPGLRIVTTSREAIGVQGEVLFPVPSLLLPEPVDAHDPVTDRLDEVANNESVRLFLERARATVPGFALDVATVGPVIEICRRLDGIPLAIELAAARVNVLSVAEIADGLSDRFRLLTGGRRAAVPRQQTLQALIDWSWDLLGESDRILLRRLSVFAGGWTLDAAAAIMVDPLGDLDASGPVADADARLRTIDGLSRLADRSMVVVDRGATMRYGMLETIRQYARDRLVASGEAPALRTRHMAHYAALAADGARGLDGADEVLWLARLDPEVDNLRAALDWAFESDPEAALRLTISMYPYWRSRSAPTEAFDWFTRAIDLADHLPEPPPDERHERSIVVARVLALATITAVTRGQPADMLQVERAMTVARESGDDIALLDAMSTKAIVTAFQPGYTIPTGFVEEIIAIGERAEAWPVVTYATAGIAISQVVGNPGGTRRWLERADAAAHRSGNPTAIAFAALARGRVAGYLGDIDEARRSLLEAIARSDEIGDERQGIVARSELAHALRRAGVLDEAEAEYRSTIHAWERLGNRGAIANQLENLGFVARVRNDPERAARLLGAAERLREDSGASMLTIERSVYDEEVAMLRDAMDEGALASAWAEGRALSMDEAIDLSGR